MRNGLRRKVLTAASAAALAVWAAVPGLASAGTLDQQQTNGGGVTFDTDSMQSLAQTFTAGLSGRLDQVDLKLAANGTGPILPLTVEIRNAVGGSPGGTVLASGSIPASAAPPPPAAFVSLGFASPATVTAGTQYAIVVFNADVFPRRWGWAVDPSDPYAPGSAFHQATSPPGPTWLTDSSSDTAFRTFVVTQAPATGQQAAALKKCKKKRSKAKRRKCRKKAKKLPV
jgi:hypothetical protein